MLDFIVNYSMSTYKVDMSTRIRVICLLAQYVADDVALRVKKRVSTKKGNVNVEVKWKVAGDVASLIIVHMINKSKVSAVRTVT